MGGNVNIETIEDKAIDKLDSFRRPAEFGNT